MKKRFIAIAFLLSACSTHGASESADAEPRCAWCDGGVVVLQDASARLDASEPLDAALELDGGDVEPDASEPLDAALELDGGDVEPDAGELLDAAADAEPEPTGDVCTPAGVPGGVCANAQCETVCESSTLVVCCDDPVFPGGTFICRCDR